MGSGVGLPHMKCKAYNEENVIFPNENKGAFARKWEVNAGQENTVDAHLPLTIMGME